MNPKGELQELCQKKGYALPTYYSRGNTQGPSHNPVFFRTVSVNWEGKELTESCEGHSKKEAEKNAADLMLRRIRKLSRENEYKDSSEGLFPEPDMSPSQFKGQLQELLQKSIPHSSPPKYELISSRGPAHKKEFTVKCVVTLYGASLENCGMGSTVKAAESAAARNTLCLLESEGLPEEVSILSNEALQVPSTPPACESPDLLNELTRSGFKVGMEEFEGDCGVHLCLALASGGHSDTLIAAHGAALETPELACTKALSNLVASIRQLTQSC